jgi:hypothetical protein
MLSASRLGTTKQRYLLLQNLGAYGGTYSREFYAVSYNTAPEYPGKVGHKVDGIIAGIISHMGVYHKCEATTRRGRSAGRQGVVRQ